VNYLTRDRPAGPQVPPARAAASLVGALRAAHGALPWTARTISKPIANLDQETISSTDAIVSRVRFRT
jgi:hypothetical protein